VADLSEFFHRLVDMLPWRSESERNDAHTDVEDVVIPAFGRNATPAGVQTSTEVEHEEPEKSGPDSFPTGS